MRPFYDTTKEDIDNEINAITNLCTKAAHKNIVTVLRHGWLKSSPYYFIDMELCDINLETFIYTESFDGFEDDFDSIGESPEDVRIQNMWPIMMDIVSGLWFIHEHGQVHRDLKPRNSSSRTEHSNFSTLLSQCPSLEDHRLWTHLGRNVKTVQYHSVFKGNIRVSGT